MPFAIFRSKGFQITFPNGWVVSTQFGPGNYCKDYPDNPYIEPSEYDYWESPDAELWAWNEILDTPLWENPRGWQSPHDLLALLNLLAHAPTPVYWGA